MNTLGTNTSEEKKIDHVWFLAGLRRICTFWVMCKTSIFIFFRRYSKNSVELFLRNYDQLWQRRQSLSWWIICSRWMRQQSRSWLLNTEPYFLPDPILGSAFRNLIALIGNPLANDDTFTRHSPHSLTRSARERIISSIYSSAWRKRQRRSSVAVCVF